MDIVSVVLADCCVAYCLHCVHGSESYHYLPVVILAIKAITKIKGIIAIKAITSIKAKRAIKAIKAIKAKKTIKTIPTHKSHNS